MYNTHIVLKYSYALSVREYYTKAPYVGWSNNNTYNKKNEKKKKNKKKLRFNKSQNINDVQLHM